MDRFGGVDLLLVCLLALPAMFVRLLWVSPDSLTHASCKGVRVRGRGREGEREEGGSVKGEREGGGKGREGKGEREK